MSDIQRDREERQHVIEVLQNMVDWMESINYIVANPERRRALEYAIASIKTDLKYDLLYEETSGQADKPTTKNDLGVDLIPRADVLKLMQDNWHIYSGDLAMQESMDDIRALPLVTSIRPKGHWISISPPFDSNDIHRCSVCGFEQDGATRFCPDCGADMREVVEEW